MTLKLQGNTVNPTVLIIGVFHGDEPQGEFLIKEYLKENPDTKLLMLPRLNSENTRVNKNGVDLNRNFPTKNWILSEQNEFYGGDAPASEEETRFIISAVQKYKPSAILTLHAPYKVVNYDAGAKNITKAKSLAENISKITGYKVEENIGYPTPGSFGTWAGIENDIPAITLELDEEIDVELLKKPIFGVFSFLEKYKG